MIGDQPQRGLEIQPRSENPADHDIIDASGNPVAIFGEVPDQFRQSRDGSEPGLAGDCRILASEINGARESPT